MAFDKALMLSRRKTATVSTPGGLLTVRRPTPAEFREYLKSLPREKSTDNKAELLLVRLVVEDDTGARVFESADEVAEVLAPGEITDIVLEANRLIYGDLGNPPPTL